MQTGIWSWFAEYAVRHGGLGQFFQFGVGGVEFFDAVCAEIDGEPRAFAFIHGIYDDACAEFGVADVLAEHIAVIIAGFGFGVFRLPCGGCFQAA